MKLQTLFCVALCIFFVAATTTFALDCDNTVQWSPNHLHTEDVEFSLCYKPNAALFPPEQKNVITITSTDKIGLLFFNSAQQSGDVYKIVGQSNPDLYNDALYRNRNVRCEYHVNTNPAAQFSHCAIDIDRETGDSGIICQLKPRATITLAVDKGDVLYLKCQHLFTPQDEQFNTIELLGLSKDNLPFLQQTYLTSLIVNPQGDGQLKPIDPEERSKYLQSFAKEHQDIDLPRRYLNIQIHHINNNQNDTTTTTPTTTDDPTTTTTTTIPNDNNQKNNHMSKDFARAMCAHLCGVLDNVVRRCKCDLQHFTRTTNGPQDVFTFPISSHQNMIHNPMLKRRNTNDTHHHNPLLEPAYNNNNALVPDATQINDAQHNNTNTMLDKIIPITREILLDVLQNDKTTLQSTQRFVRDLFDLKKGTTTLHVQDQL